MHRTTFRSKSFWLCVSAGLCLVFGARSASAQQPVPEILIQKDQTYRLQMKNKQPISRGTTDRPDIVAVQEIAGEPTVWLVTGKAPGSCRVELVDKTNVPEQFVFRVMKYGDELRKEFLAKLRTTFPSVKDVDVVLTTNAATITGTAPDSKTLKNITEFAKAAIPGAVVSMNLPEGMRKEFEQLVSSAIPGARVNVFVAGGNIVVAGTAETDTGVKAIERAAKNTFGEEVVVSVTIATADETPARVPQVQQVELEVIVAVVNRSEFRNISFNWVENRKNYFIGSILGPTNGLGLGFVNAIATGLGGASQSAAANPNLQFGVVGDRGAFLGFLEALRTEGLAKVMSEPRIVAMAGRKTLNAATNAGTAGNGNVGNSQNNNAASINTAGTSTSNRPYILSGGETPVIIPSSPGSPPTVQYKQFGTRIEFEPVVLQNGKIQLDVAAELSNINPANGIVVQGIAVPGFDSRKAETSVQIEPGQTLAIGGLIQNTITAQAKKVPVLGDIPFLGTAFSSTEHKEKEEEMIVLVTPRLVDPMNCTQLPRRLPGRETRPADDFELFLTQILEAPRGPREVFADGHYRAAHMNGPTAGTYPCGDNSWGRGGCANGNCNNGGTSSRCATTTQPASSSVGVGHVDLTPIEPRETLPTGNTISAPPLATIPVPETPTLPMPGEAPRDLPPATVPPVGGVR